MFCSLSRTVRRVMLLFLVLASFGIAACGNDLAEPSNYDIAELIPNGGGWQVIARTSFTLDGEQRHIAAVVGRPDYLSSDGRSWEVLTAVLVLRKDTGQWVVVWRSPEEKVFTGSGDEFPTVDLASLTAGNEALVAVDLVELGASASFHRFAVYRLEGSRSVAVEDQWDAVNSAMEVYENEILIRANFPQPQRILRRNDDGTLSVTVIGPSELARAKASAGGAQVAQFVLDGTDVRPVGSDTLTVKAGDTIVFVPADERTQKAFDAGEILIYSNAWNGPPLTAARANVLPEPSYTFPATGEFHFALVYQSSTDTQGVLNPTFTVIVTPP